MADNLCGPSAPTKGLVGHLDRDRTVQQDRVVVSSPAHAGSSFRSLPGAHGHSGVSNDAAFAAFTTGPGQHVGPLMPLPDRSRAHEAAQANFGPRHFFPSLDMASPGHQAVSSGTAAANTQWVQDFQRMQLSSQGPRSVSGNNNAIREDLLKRGVPSTSIMENPSLDYETRRRLVEMQQQHLSPAMPMGQTQFRGHLLDGQMESFLRCAPDGAVLPSPVQSHHYPRELELAATSEEALESAFAAYDEDFQAEMDQWMEHNAPAGRDEARRETFMSEFEWEQNWKQETELLVDQSQNRDDLLQKQRKVLEDRKLQQAALETLRAVNNGEEKSAELREKIQNSTFVGLLGRLSSGEVAVDGNELFDNVKGTTIDLGQESDVRHAMSTPPEVQDGYKSNDSRAEDTGKGKEKAHGEQSHSA